jgi:2-polyprenyl-6-methoxyphenol hydroxylase-like FAD-dependent oxidoreductase
MVIDLPGAAVLGAGPIGCLTAIYLLRRGFPVDLFESRADMRKDALAAGRSINLILTSRGLNALNEVGLTAEIIQRCVPVYGRGLHLQDGTQTYQAYGPDSSYCNYAISRSDLNIALLNAAEAAGARIHFNHPVDHVDVGRKTIFMYIQGHSIFRTPPRLKSGPKPVSGNDQPHTLSSLSLPNTHTYGIAVRAQVIFSTDGVNSRGRHSLHQFLQSSTGVSAGVATPFGHALSAIEPQNNQTTLPGSPDTTKTNQPPVFPTDFKSAFDLSGSHETTIPLRVSYLELLLSKDSNINKETGEQILSTKALHIWPRGKHFLMALPNKDDSFTLTLYLPDAPVGTAPSFSSLKTDDDIINYFSQYFPDTLPLLPDLTNQWNSHPKGFLGSMQAFPWHFRSNILLLGDAGAAVTPFFGQGCNSGMESVCTLFQHLDYFAKVKVPTVPNWQPILSIFPPKQSKSHYTPYVIQKAFSTMSSNHKINTDAIASMAVENYIEMGTSTSDPAFLRGAQYETALTQNFPQFLSAYAMTTHCLIPYSVVYTLGKLQKQAILKPLINDEIAANGPITAETLLTPPTLDLKKVKSLLDKKYHPILDKYSIDQHALRDVTRELVQQALNAPKQLPPTNKEAKL